MMTTQTASRLDTNGGKHRKDDFPDNPGTIHTTGDLLTLSAMGQFQSKIDLAFSTRETE